VKRGVSDVVAAVFVIAAILGTAYVLTNAYITYTTNATLAFKQTMERWAHAAQVQYSTGKCNADSGLLEVNYTGNTCELAVRFICFDLLDPPGSACVVPYVSTGTRSAQYISRYLPGTVDLNFLECNTASALQTACRTNRMVCFAVGAYAAREIPVEQR